MSKIRALAFAVSLLLAGGAVADTGFDAVQADPAPPLWRLLLDDANSPLALIQGTAEGRARALCFENCSNSCGVRWRTCITGSSQTYINQTCRPNNQRCNDQCRNQCR